MDNHNYTHTPNRYQCLLAVDAIDTFRVPVSNPGTMQALQQFLQQHNDWLFGHFNFDFGHPSHLPDTIGFPDAFLFQPATVIELQQHTVHISCYHHTPEQVFRVISAETPASAQSPAITPAFTPRISQADYIAKIQALQKHILRGDCYEINFCQEFYAASAQLNPLATYLRLAAASPAPFAAYYKTGEHHLLCASPERYVYREAQTLLSQPIKGTARRDTTNVHADELLRQQLFNSSKDRSENVMVVDLVRNDFSRLCLPGSVHVQELFGVYSFPQVHQLISTITGTLPSQATFAAILEATFPMGSMTGAPKQKVLELTSRYETVKRGIYSGTVGYIKPGGDFDFNVVIRSLLYNAQTQYLSYLVGGGITFYSDAAKEYEECLLKAAGIKKALL
ncbi:anthranilate synthase component I family protein [Deminuibacter soli]|uniref:anthranilate synthase component I family protein n=1 Tax=Deminuibacter soli TaxID=2291815 RepID=UPI001FE92FFC|nr:anthranilate synthase component I family protein [Deminuibacter soli]